MKKPTNSTLSTDQLLVLEAKEIFDGYVEKAKELLARGIVISLSMTNGMDGNPIAVTQFSAIKTIKLPEPQKAEQDNA